MNLKEYNQLLKKESSVPFITVDDVAGDDRTLAVGGSPNDYFHHLYLRNGLLHMVYVRMMQSKYVLFGRMKGHSVSANLKLGHIHGEYADYEYMNLVKSYGVEQEFGFYFGEEPLSPFAREPFKAMIAEDFDNNRRFGGGVYNYTPWTPKKV